LHGVAEGATRESPAKMDVVRHLSRSGLAAALLVSMVVVGSSTLASAAPTHQAKDPPDFVLANGSGSDFQVESPETGQIIKDLGGIPGYTNNGMALAPNGHDLYVTVNRDTSLAVERIDLKTGNEAFVAYGEEPSISPNGRFLAFGSEPGSQLSVRDLKTDSVQTINLDSLLGQETDLVNASIAWVGTEIVVLPGGIANDLMGDSPPAPLQGSCSAVSISSTCLIVVRANRENALSARRAVLRGVKVGDTVIGGLGPTDLVLATFDGQSTVVSEVDLATETRVARLCTVPGALPVAVDASGRDLFYLQGHGPVALWVGKLSPHRLTNAKILNPNVASAGLAW
jgi:hypothetical protein